MGVLSIAARHSTSAREEDAEMLGRAIAGDPVAQRALVEAHQGQVAALLHRMLAPSGLASLVEDLAQETFLRAMAALHRFDPQGPARFSTWLLEIAARLAAVLERRRASTASDEEPESKPASEKSGTPKLDMDSIRDVVQEDLVPLAEECYENALADAPELAESVVLRFKIVGDESVGGLVDDVRIAEREVGDGNSLIRHGQRIVGVICLIAQLLAALGAQPRSDSTRASSCPSFYAVRC